MECENCINYKPIENEYNVIGTYWLPGASAKIVLEANNETIRVRKITSHRPDEILIVALISDFVYDYDPELS